MPSTSRLHIGHWVFFWSHIFRHISQNIWEQDLGLIGLIIKPKHIGHVGIWFLRFAILGLIEASNYIKYILLWKLDEQFFALSELNGFWTISFSDIFKYKINLLYDSNINEEII